ncbi:sensor histidine kinase [Rhizomonospora bruguierae]|uniref:sensor histidine kinase n=1 Tax=Rhizomonospora bruguierae TaxID=1581705 RepID=UPI001BCCDA5E|nr:ATP-binding protein [Micromonospora sp. NBRC 107566]
MLLGRLRIRGKLTLLVLLPLLAVAGLTVPLVINRTQVAARAGDTARTVRVASEVGALVQDLQLGRLLAVGRVLGVVDRNRVVVQDAQISDRVANVRGDLGADLPAGVDAAIGTIGNLTGVQLAVLGGNAATGSVLSGYGEVIDRLIDSLRLLDIADVTTSAGRQVVALDAVLRLDEKISLGAVQLALLVAQPDSVAVARYAANLAALQPEADRFTRYATPEQNRLYLLVQQALNQRLGTALPTQIQTDPVQALARFTVSHLFPSLESFTTLGRFVERKIVNDVTAEVTAQQGTVLATAYLAAGLALLILVVVVLMSVAMARSVARPLTRLTASAERVAAVADAELRRVADDSVDGDADSAGPIRLESVDVRAGDEIGELARAFDRVQTTAARLVERQVASRRNVALMFGHVGRRTQNLVGRQLALIDRLEQQEVNPQRLQELYRLDHVSNRLRRNAGSLVVLSGAAGGEEHTAPLPLADAARLALGEIEDYTRVDVRIPPGPTLVPAVAGDLVLVLAELMENATSFSPPHTRVTVTAVGTDRGERITIEDRGLGLSPERMAEENSRLARRERLDLAPTEVLGLFVVGRLARKHGLGVALAPTAGGGVTAIVEIGAELLLDTAHAPEPRAVEPANGPWPALDRVMARAADATDAPVPLNVVALNRASRTIGTARSWNAFAPRPKGGDQRSFPARPSLPAGPAPAPAPPALAPPTPARPASAPPRPAPAPPATPLAAVPRGSASAPVSAPPAAPAPPIITTPPVVSAPPAPPAPPVVSAAPLDVPAADIAADVDVPPPPPSPPAARRPLLRQRVPGAQLPEGSLTGTAVPRPSAEPAGASAEDPVRARAVVEEFEAGVRRAQGVSGAAPATGTAPAGDAARSGLSRRVPGATLPAAPPRRETTPPPPGGAPDPEAARDLLEQFESGVLRALREVGSDRRATGSGHQQEEGTAR